MDHSDIRIFSSRVSLCIGVIVCRFLLCQGFSEKCDTWVRYSMNRTSLKFGFHRDILTNLSWLVGNGFTKHSSCDILFIEHIPQEMFIDLDEIKSQRLIKVIPLSYMTIDVEKPAHLSKEHEVLVYVNKVERSLQNSKLEISSTSVLPVHWRYQRPTENNYYTKASFSSPVVLGKCDGFIPESFQHCLGQLQISKYPCHHDTLELCQWFMLKPNQSKDDKSVHFLIPVGTKHYIILVTSMTMLVTVSSAVFFIHL